MKKYLVTGGAGFIGSHLSEALLQQGHAVTVVDNLSTGKRSNLPKGVEFIQGDICDSTVIAKAIQGVDGCFHLAAIASVEKSYLDWVGTHKVNQTATINIFNAAKTATNDKPIPVIFTSSSAVYGANDDMPLTEQSQTKPLSSYGVDKLACEYHAQIATQLHKVPTIGFRLFNVFGPRQDPSSPYSGVISKFFDQLSKEQAIDIYGNGTQSRDFIYVTDVVNGFIQAMNHNQKRAQIYNLCTSKATTILELANAIGTLLEVPVVINHTDPRAGDIAHSLGSCQKARQELAFNVTVSLQAGIQQMIDLSV